MIEWLLERYSDFARRARIVGADHLRAILRRPGAVIFEGAQGALLDEWRGFHPYTTWSTTTLANADRLLAEAGHAGPTTRIGITRAYATRHGPGPLPSEDAALDLVLLRYALAIVGPLDYLALTCLDRLEALRELWVCGRYSYNGALIERLPVAPQPSLAHQERLTDLLMGCRPELEPLASQGALPDLLSAALGPTAADKRLLPPHAS
jgi:adenylosuccinate synthase